MNWHVCSRLTMWIISALAHSGVLAQAQVVDIVGEAHAKGIVVLRTSFPVRGELHSFGLDIRLDDGSYAPAQTNPLRGHRFSKHMVRGAENTGEVVLLVPVVGRFDLAPFGFLFEEQNTYELRWDIRFKAPGAAPLKIDQTVTVGPSSNADLEFLRRIGDRGFQTKFLGRAPPEQASSELLALGLIGELLLGAQGAPVSDDAARGTLSQGSMLADLAKEIPESSFAPYAAFYAGRIFHGHLREARQLESPSPEAQRHSLYRRSEQALRLAVANGDAFLKPRALCSLAVLHVRAASWTDAEDLLAEALRGAPGQGVIETAVSAMRIDLSRLREKTTQEAARDDPP